MSNAYDSMDLDTAYEIAGGYQEADDEVFAKALEIVKADDARFAQELEKIRNAEQALSKKMQKEEDITAEAEEVFDNASFIKKEFNSCELEEKFFADEEIKEAEENTEVYDVNLDTQERFELEGEEKHTHFTMLFEKAKLDVWREQVGNKEFAEKTTEEKKKSLFAEIKSSFLGTIAHLRTAALVENEVPNAARAIENEDKNFFVKQAGSMLQKMGKAFNLKQKIKVSSSAIMAACAESEAKTSQFAKKCTELAKKVNGKNKEYYSKAAILTHQAKEFFHKKAKEAWGQRYEFIANMKDRAPKITTNLLATGVLVGATVANAPWLGAAVIGYGAYKATSAWVWPIITHARKEARLAKQDKNAPKISFFDRLEAAPKAIFSNKESRKNYFKEAGWASAAGLVGLGAAGTIASVGGSVLVQKSIQSLSSTAVYTANSLMSTIKTLKDKQKDLWSKGLAVAGTAIMSYVLVSCGDNTGSKISEDFNSNLSTDSLANDTIEVNTPGSETQAVEEVVEPISDPVSVPETWNEDMNISATQWDNMQSYFGEKFDAMYQKITDDMLQDGGVFAGKTREQVLFEYKQLGSWNLPQHQLVLAKLDSFFNDCGGSLTAEDIKAMDDVLPSGSIRDVEGTLCLRVTGRDTECGEEAILHIQKVDCGCDDVIDSSDSIPDVGETTEETSEELGSSEPEQTDFVQTSELHIQTVHTQETIVTDPAITEIKGNSLDDVKVVKDATVDDVTALNVKNKDDILLESGNTASDGEQTDFVTSESFAISSENGTGVTGQDDVVTLTPDNFTEIRESAQEQTDFVTSESFAVSSENGTGVTGQDDVVILTPDNFTEIRESAQEQTDFVTSENFAVSSESGTGVTGQDDVVTLTPDNFTEIRESAQEQTDFVTSESFAVSSENGTGVTGQDDVVTLTPDNFTEIRESAQEQTDFVTSENFAVSSESGTGVTGQDDVVTLTPDNFTEIRESAQEQTDFVTSESFAVSSESGTADVVSTAETEHEGEAVEVSDLDADRGGYNNTGLTKSQYDKLETFFRDRGGNTFEFYKDQITDEMLAKGGIFEGLTKEQALFSYKQIVEWSSNTNAGAFKDEIIALDHYFDGCNMTITASRLAAIKDLVDRVNSDGSIDGVKGFRHVQTLHYTFNDCDEQKVYTRVDVNADHGSTIPSGKKWPRMFKTIWNTPPEPETFETTEEYRIETNVYTPTVITDPDVVEFKGNSLDDVKVVKDATVDDVTALDVKNKDDILLESGTHSETTAAADEVKSEASSRAARKAAKKAAKEAQAYAEQAKAQGLTGNPYLDRRIQSMRSREN